MRDAIGNPGTIGRRVAPASGRAAHETVSAAVDPRFRPIPVAVATERGARPRRTTVSPLDDPRAVADAMAIDLPIRAARRADPDAWTVAHAVAIHFPAGTAPRVGRGARAVADTHAIDRPGSAAGPSIFSRARSVADARAVELSVPAARSVRNDTGAATDTVTVHAGFARCRVGDVGFRILRHPATIACSAFRRRVVPRVRANDRGVNHAGVLPRVHSGDRRVPRAPIGLRRNGCVLVPAPVRLGGRYGTRRIKPRVGGIFVTRSPGSSAAGDKQNDRSDCR